MFDPEISSILNGVTKDDTHENFYKIDDLLDTGVHMEVLEK